MTLLFDDLVTMLRGTENNQRPPTDAEIQRRMELYPTREDEWTKPVSLYNTMPPNLEQVDAERWAHLQVYTPVMRQFRQPTLTDATGKHAGMYGSLHIAWFHDGTGVVWAHMYERSIEQNFLDRSLVVFGTRPSMSSWAAVFFTTAVCKHDNEGKRIRNCLHAYTCRNCGYYHEVDSSD